jgi:hypothetical protein
MLLCSLIALFICSHASGYPRPIPGTENIPKLMADSTLVCKGEVVRTDEVKPSVAPSPYNAAVIAIVHMDRCFKGETPADYMVSILFDDTPPPTGGRYTAPPNGDYRLFFLKLESGKYKIADAWFGELTISRLLGNIPPANTDPMHQLELDLKAGLHDCKPEFVLDSIRMLGNMRHLESTSELIALSDSPDPLVQTYAYEAMLRLHDYSVLPAVAHWLEIQPRMPHELFLPRDALFEMQDRLAIELSQIRDPATLTALFGLLQLSNPFVRSEVLQAVRAIHSPQSADALLRMLDDPDPDNGFSAMQGLIEISNRKGIDWVPPWPVFNANQKYYAAKCREWWESEKKQAQ